MATKKPASLQALQDAWTPQQGGVLHLDTDGGPVDFDTRNRSTAGNPFMDTASAEAYKGLLTRSADRRLRLERDDQDAQYDAMGAEGQRSKAAAGWGRMQTDAARQGYNSQWTPFFEAQRVIGDNLGKPVKMNVGSLALPGSNKPGLPAGYTEGQYGDEVNAFVNGGEAPGFTDSDTSNFPDVGQRLRQEVRARQQRAPSMQSLAKQGGY